MRIPVDGERPLLVWRSSTLPPPSGSFCGDSPLMHRLDIRDGMDRKLFDRSET